MLMEDPLMITNPAAVRWIRFNADMVRQIQRNHKTQTRRPVEPQPALDEPWRLHEKDATGQWFRPRSGDVYPLVECPYGQPGDRLQVQLPSRTEARKLGWEVGDFNQWLNLWLEITDVRAERLQEISSLDAVAEGIEAIMARADAGWGYRDYSIPGPTHGYAAVDNLQSFQTMWDQIYQDRPELQWAQDPWCWAITFRRVQARYYLKRHTDQGAVEHLLVLEGRAGDAGELLATFEADSWEDARRQQHEFLGWEPYRPMTEDKQE